MRQTAWRHFWICTITLSWVRDTTVKLTLNDFEWHCKMLLAKNCPWRKWARPIRYWEKWHHTTLLLPFRSFYNCISCNFRPFNTPWQEKRYFSHPHTLCIPTITCIGRVLDINCIGINDSRLYKTESQESKKRRTSTMSTRTVGRLRQD